MRTSRLEFPTRTTLVLQAIVRQHIRSGTPVPSTQIAKMLRDRWSSATIRSEVASLVDQGLVAKAHSSAAAIPTADGFRWYAESIIRDAERRSAARPSARRNGRSGLNRTGVSRAFSGALNGIPYEGPQSWSEALALTSSLVGLVVAEPANGETLDHLYIQHRGARDVMVVLVTSPSGVQSRAVQLDFDVTASDVEQFCNYLNSHYCGRPLAEIRARIDADIESDRQLAEVLIAKARRIAARALDATAEPTSAEVYIQGTHQLFALSEFQDLDRLRDVMVAVERKELWRELLIASVDGGGIHLSIGGPDLPEGLNVCTLISAPFDHPDGTRGRLGILGPMRMDYAEVIPLVQSAAHRLTTR